jgi:hypothetical protein
VAKPEHNETIYILDQVTAKPGQAQAFLAAYMEHYAPAARGRGMTLVHRWITPPLWLKEQSNTLHIVWTVQGAAAWWAMSQRGRGDPTVRDFWDSIEPLIETRHRSFLSDVADVESLCDV